MLSPIHPTVHLSPGRVGSNGRSLAFDLDWTLVRPVRGFFPKTEQDYAFLPYRILALQKYSEAGYSLIIFSNQKYRGKQLTLALNRINRIIAELEAAGVAPWVVVATGDDQYRKPEVGMWNLLQTQLPQPCDLYVGDAAGRPGDFSDSDRLFAEAIGIPFAVPQVIFPQNSVVIPSAPALFIFVGMPGAGKTSYYQHYLQPAGWVHANQDLLKTNAKVLQTVRRSLEAGQAVAVDATNPTAEKRAGYIAIAAELKVPTLILYFVDNGSERNAARERPVPKIAYHTYFKNLVEPSLEGDGVPVVEIETAL